MPRLLFEKTGNAVWMSHLDTMRLFQRAFKRSGLNLKHTQGFNPRPSVSIALPLSVGVESNCELLDFELEGQAVSGDAITTRLNDALIPGVRVRQTYEDGRRLRDLALLDCLLTLEYDGGVPLGTMDEISALFRRERLDVEKKGKNGITQQDIIPMIRQIRVEMPDEKTVQLAARICCQNPTLNPMQLAAAIGVNLPQCRPDFVRCRRVELYDTQEQIFR